MDVYLCILNFEFCCCRFVHSLPFATVKAEEVSGSQPAEVLNLGMQHKTRKKRIDFIFDGFELIISV